MHAQSDDSISLVLYESVGFTGDLRGLNFGADPMREVEMNWWRIPVLGCDEDFSGTQAGGCLSEKRSIESSSAILAIKLVGYLSNNKGAVYSYANYKYS